MYRVTKIIDFCYGHRLLGYGGKSKAIHGHSARLVVTLESETLDERGMVCDFREVKEVVLALVRKDLDHRMILRQDDPLVAALEAVGETPYRMQENPTAENLAKLLFERIRQLGFPVAAVRFWETRDSVGEYRQPG